jgi:hypothetical protein
MNIHFKDDFLLHQLRNATLAKLMVGSHMYNLNDVQSDEDYLCIYAPSKIEQQSFSFTNHQLQYKDADTADYNFVNLYNFIRNTINGDSTINFEVVNSEQLLGTPLAFLYEKRECFNNYMVMRSYLGLARRDLKQIGMGATERDKNKKLLHAIRGYHAAKMVHSHTFSNTLDTETHSLLNSVKKFNGYSERYGVIEEYTHRVDDFRKQLNTELDEGKLTRFMKPDDQASLDKAIKDLVESEYYKNKIHTHMNIMEMIYDANENGIKYN